MPDFSEAKGSCTARLCTAMLYVCRNITVVPPTSCDLAAFMYNLLHAFAIFCYVFVLLTPLPSMGAGLLLMRGGICSEASQGGKK